MKKDYIGENVDSIVANYTEYKVIPKKEFEVWELIQRYPDELSFIIHSKDYMEYLDTFPDDDRINVPYTGEEFNLIKKFFRKENKYEIGY